VGDDSQVKVPDHIGLHVSNEKVIWRENMTILKSMSNYEVSGRCQLNFRLI